MSSQESIEEKLLKAGLTLMSHFTLKGDSYRETCVKCDKNLVYEVSEGKIKDKPMAIYSCEECGLYYLLPESREKSKDLDKMTPEKFREMAKETDWSDYGEKVGKEMTKVVKKHGDAQRKSYERGLGRVVR